MSSAAPSFDPWDSPFDAKDQEVLDTFNTISTTPEAALGAYVISMASSPSDVLAVQLLLKSTGALNACPWCRYLRH
ncbi:MAG: hypothetical protein CM15mP74_31680 [Halieaceae bacterium]|nr:MAG: hypothetical protein CM15mP74_31680 [Halieaceae bacterium]